jgi:hypothetical protein
VTGVAVDNGEGDSVQPFFRWLTVLEEQPFALVFGAHGESVLSVLTQRLTDISQMFALKTSAEEIESRAELRVKAYAALLLPVPSSVDVVPVIAQSMVREFGVRAGADGSQRPDAVVVQSIVDSVYALMAADALSAEEQQLLLAPWRQAFPHWS